MADVGHFQLFKHKLYLSEIIKCLIKIKEL